MPEIDSAVSKFIPETQRERERKIKRRASFMTANFKGQEDNMIDIAD